MTKKTQKKMRKALVLLACAALLVCITVGVTVAYLTDSKSVKNTFTVGSVEIALKETPVDAEGKKTTAAPVDKGNAYHLYPAHEYDKDPTITVGDTSEDCWLFVNVENGIAAIEDTTNTIADQMGVNGWTLVAGETTVYAYKEVAKAKDVVPVFESFKIADTVEDVTDYGEAEVVITAYAVQEDGFGTAQAAWDATFGK